MRRICTLFALCASFALVGCVPPPHHGPEHGRPGYHDRDRHGPSRPAVSKPDVRPERPSHKPDVRPEKPSPKPSVSKPEARPGKPSVSKPSPKPEKPKAPAKPERHDRDGRSRQSHDRGR